MRKVLSISLVIIFITILSACGQADSEKNANEEVKNKTEQTNNEQNGDDSKKEPELSATINFEELPNFEGFEGTIDHIHGIGYAGNVNALYLAAHDGLKVLADGKWYKTKTENNDYMGFNAVEKGFLSSGHPGVDSSLPNPVGVVKSFDHGQTLDKLGLTGETDFHLFGVGYESNTIYALPPNNNSEMKAGNLYVSTDLAKSWTKVAAKGLKGNPSNMAVHPTKSDTVAIAGENGVYLSTDKGENFEEISTDMMGTSVYFSSESLWYGGYDGNAILVKRSLEDQSEEVIKLPKMEQDAVMYLAQNPKDENEIVFVSVKGNLYRSTDGAKTWNILLENGEIQ